MADTAVMLLAFGGPQTREEVRPFIDRVTAGRNIPAARLDQVVQQYDVIGGKSPFNELTFKQASAIEKALGTSKQKLPVHVGMLYSEPSIKDTLGEIVKSGGKNVVAIVMAAHRTEASFERYTNAFQQARLDIQTETGVMVQVQYLDSWHTHPLFIEAVSDRVISTLDKMTQPELDTARVLFTAHSVPQEMSDRSGYAEQIQATASSVASRVRGRTGRALPWSLAYQSRSGSPTQPWLDPDLQHEMAVSKKLGKTHVVIVPVGFLCDHVEVLFDLDVQAAQTASELGMCMKRAPTVGDHPTFIRLLAELAADRAESFYAKPER
jgi:ferrochelatase